MSAEPRRAPRHPVAALLALLTAALAPAGCDAPPAPVEVPRDDGARQVAAERAAEQRVTDEVTLRRLSREVAELHVEVDRIKASRQALEGRLLEARLQALEARAADDPRATATLPPAAPPATAARAAHDAAPPAAPRRVAPAHKDGGR